MFSASHDALTAETPQSLFRLVGLSEPTAPATLATFPPTPAMPGTPEHSALTSAGTPSPIVQSPVSVSMSSVATPEETPAAAALEAPSFPAQSVASVAVDAAEVLEHCHCVNLTNRWCRGLSCDCVCECKCIGDKIPLDSTDSTRRALCCFCEPKGNTSSEIEAPKLGSLEQERTLSSVAAIAVTSLAVSKVDSSPSLSPISSAADSPVSSAAIAIPVKSRGGANDSSRKARKPANRSQQLFDLSSVSGDMPALGESPAITPSSTPLSDSSVPQLSQQRTPVSSVWGKSILKIATQPPSPSSGGSALPASPQAVSELNLPRAGQNRHPKPKSASQAVSHREGASKGRPSKGRTSQSSSPKP